MKIEEMSEERRQRLLEAVERMANGEIPPQAFEDESLAPEIDEVHQELLVMLVRRQVPDSIRDCLYRRIVTFKSWCDAHTEVLVAEWHRKKRG